MSLQSFLRDIRRSRFFRHGLVLGLVIGAPFGWLAKPPPKIIKPTTVRAAVGLPVEVSRGFPQGEEIIFTVRVRNKTPRVFASVEASCAFVDVTGAVLGSGSQSWSAVGLDQTVVGTIRAPALLGTTKAECQARGE
ncbi:hypothetical protein [Caulobacter sp. Root487D2Y]|uniref:hypothetical protein n=1 Tax=Caulobacter sp. Root487D2Y TaxID=1736547 RepID=UPI000A9BB13E|nr:hypothetical protein [Caulobacter sp. Root487D2Y]